MVVPPLPRDKRSRAVALDAAATTRGGAMHVAPRDKRGAQQRLLMPPLLLLVVVPPLPRDKGSRAAALDAAAGGGGAMHVAPRDKRGAQQRLLMLSLLLLVVVPLLPRDKGSRAAALDAAAARDCHGYGFTRGVSKTGDTGTGTVTKFRHRP